MFLVSPRRRRRRRRRWGYLFTPHKAPPLRHFAAYPIGVGACTNRCGATARAADDGLEDVDKSQNKYIFVFFFNVESVG